MMQYQTLACGIKSCGNESRLQHEHLKYRSSECDIEIHSPEIKNAEPKSLRPRIPECDIETNVA